ncbi:hypothetical protein JCGZ_22166 [Jatropha curcas]|uniref:DUF4408 domain-containing protein n=1 Tax=Jatropha curcas TaxID=180498 RepID=A0A067LJV9_JATCU|nr:uncharacterized protein LOC119370844 [Jatropha curcas]KDP44584.1 hypothetical protein JCGZ_22166 [Jatropha curcas]
MDFFNFDNVKAEKAGAMLWYNHLRCLTKLFRLLEFCLALVFVSWLSNRLPFAFKISGEFFRKIAGVIASPIFVFMLCNSIIAALIFKSRRFSGENPAADNAETELYEELLKKNENRCSEPLSENPSPSPYLPFHATEQIEFQDKEVIISEVNAFSQTGEGDNDTVEFHLSSFSGSDLESDSDTPRVYRRSKSEKLDRKLSEKDSMNKLQRSETEKYINAVKSSTTDAGEGLTLENELSDEEFQRAVDEFIAKHLRFRRQESLSTVLQNQNSVPEVEKI